MTDEHASELDEAIAGLANLARAIHSYYAQLLEQGFDKPEAFALAVAYQGQLVAAQNAQST